MMSFKRNERSIVEYDSGAEFPQHIMLKRLMEKSGLGRNEWHNKANELVKTRSLGSATKLSDIFSGGNSRSLPMKDIVPYIQALNLNKREEDYYICEFFRAYCDENLHQYIRNTSSTKDVSVNLRVQVLEEKLFELRHQIAENRFLNTFFTKNKTNMLERELAVYSSAYKAERKLLVELSNLVFIKKPLREGFAEDIYDHLHEPPIEVELGWEREANVFEEEEKYRDLESVYLEKAIAFELANWFLLFQLILQRNNNESFLEYVALFLPKDCINSIEFYLEQQLYFRRDYSLPFLRSNREVLMQLFSDFMTENPDDFKTEFDAYVEYTKLDHSQLARAIKIPNFELSPNSEEPDEIDNIFRMNQMIDDNGFRKYCLKRQSVVSGFIPSELEYLRPRVRSFMPDEYKHYIQLNSLGVLNRKSVAEFYQLSSPSIDPKILQDTSAISAISSNIESAIDALSNNEFENPLTKYRENTNFPNNLSFTANSKLETVKFSV